MKREYFIEDTVQSLVDAVNQEDPSLLLSKDEVWKQLKADTEITSYELKKLREGLKKHAVVKDAEVEEMCQKEKIFREMLSELYPEVKRSAEERIQQLHALAEKADKVHKRCTITNVVANSTGIVGGLMSLASVAMAPLTGGASLAPLAPGFVLSLAAAGTNVVSSFIERRAMSSIEAEVRKLEATGVKLRMFLGALSDNTRRIPTLVNDYKVMREILRHTHSINVARLSPKAAAQSSSLISEVFGGTAKTMTKEASVIGGAATGAAILVDVYNLVQDSRDLLNGAKSESGEKLRQLAEELEDKLEELTEFYERLIASE